SQPFTLRGVTLVVCSKNLVRNRTRLDCWTPLSLRCIERGGWHGRSWRSLQPTSVVKGVSKNAVQCGRINLIGRGSPIGGLLCIVMLKFPSCLSVVECGGVASKLELIHHRVRTALFSFEQKRHVDLEFDEFCRLILVAAGCALI